MSYYYKTLVTIVLLIFALSVYGNERDSTNLRKTKIFYKVNASVGLSIASDNYTEYFGSNKILLTGNSFENPSFSLGADISYLHKSSFGIMSGIHYSKYSYSQSMLPFLEEDSLYGYDNLLYAKYDKKIEITFVEIPIRLLHNKKFHEGKNGIIYELGVGLNFPVESKYTRNYTLSLSNKEFNEESFNEETVNFTVNLHIKFNFYFVLYKGLSVYISPFLDSPFNAVISENYKESEYWNSLFRVEAGFIYNL